MIGIVLGLVGIAVALGIPLFVSGPGVPNCGLSVPTTQADEMQVHLGGSFT